MRRTLQHPKLTRWAQSAAFQSRHLFSPSNRVFSATINRIAMLPLARGSPSGPLQCISRRLILGFQRNWMSKSSSMMVKLRLKDFTRQISKILLCNAQNGLEQTCCISCADSESNLTLAWGVVSTAVQAGRGQQKRCSTAVAALPAPGLERGVWPF